MAYTRIAVERELGLYKKNADICLELHKDDHELRIIDDEIEI